MPGEVARGAPPNAPVGEGAEQIPVMRPRLVDRDAIEPYLRRIDADRIYTNWGPLVGELEVRLASQFAMQPGSVVAATSGTTALAGAIMATAGRAGPERPLAVLPSYTFIATASALEQCGYELRLADVDVDDWMMNPDRLDASPGLDRVGVVVPVGPFGRAVPQRPWLDFRERTGIPVVIDGAAGFEAISRHGASCAGAIPVGVSFHATKAFSTGEGGCVACADPGICDRVFRALNHGLTAERTVTTASINGKLSEYHAAVGLAELDVWPKKAGDFARVNAAYREVLSARGIGDRFVNGPHVGSTYALFRCLDSEETRHVMDTFLERGIDHRLWYGHGLHRHPYLAHADRGALPVTDDLAPRLLGLPTAVDLDEATMERVADALVVAISRHDSDRGGDGEQ